MLLTRPGMFSILNCKISRVYVAFDLSHGSIYSYQLHVFSRLYTIHTDIENRLLWVVRCMSAFRHMMVRRFRFVPLLTFIFTILIALFFFYNRLISLYKLQYCKALIRYKFECIYLKSIGVKSFATPKVFFFCCYCSYFFEILHDYRGKILKPC